VSFQPRSQQELGASYIARRWHDTGEEILRLLNQTDLSPRIRTELESFVLNKCSEIYAKLTELSFQSRYPITSSARDRNTMIPTETWPQS
jgi:hypothetical protein